MNWILDREDLNLFTCIPSLLLVTLFCFVILLSIQKLEDYWGLTYTQIDWKSKGMLLLLLIFWILLINVIFIVWHISRYPGMPLDELLVKGWDISIDRYHPIAERWYENIPGDDHTYRICFYPLYPILLRIVKTVTGNYGYAYLVLNNICAFLCGILAYKLARKELGDRNTALKAVKYIFLMPAAFFLFVPMTESLFLLLTMACIYCLYEKKYLATGILAFCATLTRVQGMLLIVPIMIEYIGEFLEEYRNRTCCRKNFLNKVLVILTIPLGFGIYLWINYSVYGNPFQFLIYQKEIWFNQMTPFWNTIQYLVSNGLNWHANGNPAYWGISIPAVVTLFGSMILILMGVRKRRISLTAYSLAYFVFSFGTTWLLSAPRYAVCLFPLAFTLAEISARKRWLNITLTLSYIFMFLFYLYQFMIRNGVY